MQNIEINIHGFRFIEIETGYVAKPNRTAINRVPLSALVYGDVGPWRPRPRDLGPGRGRPRPQLRIEISARE